MVKIFICIVVIISSTLIGKSFTDKHAKKLSFFSLLKDFNSSLKRNVKFRRQNLIELLDLKSNDEDFNCFLSSYKLKVLSKSDEEYFYPKWIDNDDKYFLKSYIEGIGKNGSQSELDFINSYEEIIDEKLLKIKEDKRKFANLGQKLGFIFGVGLVVIII